MSKPSWPPIEVIEDDKDTRIYVAGILDATLSPGIDTKHLAMERVKEIAAKMGRTLNVTATGTDGTFLMEVASDGTIAALDAPKKEKRTNTQTSTEPESNSAGTIEELAFAPVTLSSSPPPITAPVQQTKIEPEQIDLADQDRDAGLEKLDLEPFSSTTFPFEEVAPVSKRQGKELVIFEPANETVAKKRLAHKKPKKYLAIGLATALVIGGAAFGFNAITTPQREPVASPDVQWVEDLTTQLNTLATKRAQAEKEKQEAEAAKAKAQAEKEKQEQKESTEQPPEDPVEVYEEPAPQPEQVSPQIPTAEVAEPAPAPVVVNDPVLTSLNTSISTAGGSTATVSVTVGGSGSHTVNVNVGGVSSAVTVSAPGTGSVTLSGVPLGTQSWSTSSEGLSNSGSVTVY